MNEVRNNKLINIFNSFMFILVFSVRTIIDVLDEKGVLPPGMDNLRYALLAVAIVLCSIEILLKRNRNKKYIFIKELIAMTIICGIFLGYSMYLSRNIGVPLNKRTYVEIAYIFMPAIYSFCIVNLYEFKTLENIMKKLFWVYFVIYMYSINIFAITIKDIMEISFSKSTSYFESSVFGFPMLVLFFFFSYYRKNNKGYWIASFILTLLTFKRMIFIWAIIVFILDNIIEFRFNIKKSWKYFFMIFFIIATVIYFGALTDSGIGYRLFTGLGIDLETETMGRKWFLSILLNSGYSSYGYGSTSVALGEVFRLGDVKYLEMDLVKIYFELGIGCLSIFCFYFWKITKDNFFNIIIMLVLFMNLLVSHSITDPFDWTVVYIIIICVSQNLSNRNDLAGKKKYVITYR